LNGCSFQHTAGILGGGHAVKILGWGVDQGVPYWLVANSWNTDWGEDAYKRQFLGKRAYAVDSDAESIQKEIMTFGPVEAAFEVYTDFLNYAGGIYKVCFSLKFRFFLFLRAIKLPFGKVVCSIHKTATEMNIAKDTVLSLLATELTGK
ncbi:unnamed protein product, partial [Gongylonema pulchrum]|uniref:Pept_C1 domain-containing protein n=1 Tax=Gongylonema pulchrum TaxID=637853 RepID=A0A183DZX7_9BILA